MTIVVAGAGIVGLSIAYELASRGARVQVIDPRGIGQGATRASAGMLAPYIEGHFSDLLTLGVHGLERYDGFVERVCADAGRDVETGRNGTLQVALGAGDAQTLQAAAAALAANGVDHQLLDAAAARQAEPGLSACTTAALLVPMHGYVAAQSLAAALADAASRRGAILTTGRVLSVDDTGRGVRVATGDGIVEADAVVIAAGSWSSALLPPGATPPGAGALVKPIRGQLLHLRLPVPPATRVLWGGGCYIVPWRDGTVLVGATVEDAGFDEHATAAGVRQLLDAATTLLPALAAARFQDVRVGLRPLLADELPALGRSTTMRHVFYAIGHYRSGVLLAPLTAQLLADLVLDGREGPDLALVRPARVGL